MQNLLNEKVKVTTKGNKLTYTGLVIKQENGIYWVAVNGDKNEVVKAFDFTDKIEANTPEEILSNELESLLKAEGFNYTLHDNILELEEGIYTIYVNMPIDGVLSFDCYTKKEGDTGIYGEDIDRNNKTIKKPKTVLKYIEKIANR